jgi:hypothetical protein
VADLSAVDGNVVSLPRTGRYPAHHPMQAPAIAGARSCVRPRRTNGLLHAAGDLWITDRWLP